MSVVFEKRMCGDLRQKKQDRFSKGAKKRVALQMRVSTKKQMSDDKEDPIPVQREKLLSMISKIPDWEPAHYDGKLLEYTEITSAFKVSRSDRKLLNKAFIDAKNDLFDVLLLFKHDRLSRISEEYPTILRDFWEMGIEVWDYEKKQPLGVTSQTDKVVRFLEGWQSETESVNTSFRVVESMKNYAMRGCWLGGKAPYGYKYKEPIIDDKVDAKGRPRKKVVRGIEIDPNEAKLVEIIFSFYNKGYGSTKICEVLNNPPYLACKRNGKPFDHTTILSIIRNPICIGYPTWGKTSYRDGYFKKIPKGQWIKAKERVEELQIISDEMFNEAQKYYEERSKQARKGKKVSRRSFACNRLLTGLAFCGYCGESLLSKTYSNPKRNYKREGYICRSKKRRAPCEAKRGFFVQEELESKVVSAVKEMLKKINAGSIEDVVARIKESYNKEAIEGHEEIGKIYKEIKKLKKLQDYYTSEFNKLLAGEETELPDTVIREQIYSIADKLKTAEIKKEELESTLKKKPINIESLSSNLLLFRNWLGEYEKGDNSYRKALLESVIDRIMVYDDHINIIYNFDFEKIVSFCASMSTEEPQ